MTWKDFTVYLNPDQIAIHFPCDPQPDKIGGQVLAILQKAGFTCPNGQERVWMRARTDKWTTECHKLAAKFKATVVDKVGSRKSEVGSRKFEVGSLESEVGSNTKFQSHIVHREDKEDKGDSWGEKVPPMNATWYKSGISDFRLPTSDFVELQQQMAVMQTELTKLREEVEELKKDEGLGV